MGVFLKFRVMCVLMSFVRLKRVGSARYAYVVENYWTAKGSRQKATKYLGKALDVPATKEVSYADLPTRYGELVRVLVHKELEKRNFLLADQYRSFEEILINLHTGTFVKNGKSVVIPSNEGFLCAHTFEQLLNFSVKQEGFERDLANVLLEAGIDLPKEYFVALCDAARKN